jgi:thiamine biosynthesis lipoprotein
MPAATVRGAAGGLLTLVILLLAACGDGQQEARRELRGATMGTTWSVVYVDSVGIAAEELREKIDAELAAINDALSTYQDDSEISRLNASPAGTYPVSAMFAEVLGTALRIGALTDSAYDVTVGPLVDLWGFGSTPRTGVPPTADAIAAAQTLVGAERLHLDAQRRLLTREAGTQIDLSSIAKGYAVDRVLGVVAGSGVRRALVEIGGELRAIGERPGGGAWRLAVEAPRPATSRVQAALAVSDAAVATSGDYRNFFEVDGRRFAHLVDPRTGYPVAHDLVSVTVIAPTCVIADAWATALIVLGREAALALAGEQGLAAYLVSVDDGDLAVDYTPAFSAYFAAAGRDPAADASGGEARAAGS